MSDCIRSSAIRRIYLTDVSSCVEYLHTNISENLCEVSKERSSYILTLCILLRTHTRLYDMSKVCITSPNSLKRLESGSKHFCTDQGYYAEHGACSTQRYLGIIPSYPGICGRYVNAVLSKRFDMI